MPTKEKLLLNPREVAEELGGSLNVKTIRVGVERGEIPAQRIGPRGLMLIPRWWVDRLRSGPQTPEAM